jgi:hypothetical protein
MINWFKTLFEVIEDWRRCREFRSSKQAVLLHSDGRLTKMNIPGRIYDLHLPEVIAREYHDAAFPDEQRLEYFVQTLATDGTAFFESRGIFSDRRGTRQ